MLTSDITPTARPTRTLAFPEEEETTVSSPIQKKRRPWMDRLFQETMKPSDRLRLAALAAAGEQATSQQTRGAQQATGLGNGANGG